MYPICFHPSKDCDNSSFSARTTKGLSWDMDALSCGSCRTHVPLLSVLTISNTNPTPLVHLLLRSWIHLPHLISLLFLRLIVVAQQFNDPSTNWNLSEYYPPSWRYSEFRSSDFTFCINGSYLELLNEEPGLYGRIVYDDGLYVDSAHDSTSVPYAVFFKLYFVIAAEMVCMKDNGSIPAYYLSLVAEKFADLETSQNQNYIVIWTANPNKPVTQNACLQLNDSDITLVDYHDSMGSSPDVVWQISPGTSFLSLAINFEGNLVLFSNSSHPPYVPLWESFLNPTDTLMVLQVLENNSTLTVNSSSSANYTMAIQNGRLFLYAEIPNDEGRSSYVSPYWSLPSLAIAGSGNINITFASFCWDSVNQLRLYAGSNRSYNSTEYGGMVSPEFCSIIPNNSDTAISITGLHHSMSATYATLLRLEADGDLRGYTVDNATDGSNSTWRTFYSLFNNTPCDLPLYCGFSGMCDPERKDGIYCTCSYDGSGNDPELVFTNDSVPNAGCKIKNDELQIWQGGKESRCGSSVRFLTVQNVHYFSIDFTMRSQDVFTSADCKGECETNCSCAGAFWNESVGSCFLVPGRLGTIRKQGTMLAFIKYAKVSRNLWWEVVVPLLASAILVASISLAYYLRRRAAQQMSELENQRLVLLSRLDCSNIQRFTWKQMHEYTCSFSDLLGAGGFGRVFRGALPDRRAIAVKQLGEDGCQGQGDKEFIAEVSILSRIRHAHLVRLIGFCLEGTHRLLVYEYMENNSLDAKLFKRHATSMVQETYDSEQQDRYMNEKDKGGEPLSWKIRFQIAMGIAKGLAYLHEECEEKVIHMDLKPQNILLDSNFQAKISDFGMSKRTRREQSSVMTVMRGTPGYLAPEWLLDCAITEKCDVYSFGIVLLELVSGRKVKDLRALKQKLSMRPLRESVMLDFLDESLRYGSDVDEREAVRMVEVALFCVRRDPVKRPSMGNVALMLEGKEGVLQEVADVFDGEDGALDLELVGYPSAMHSFMSLGTGSSYRWWSSDADSSRSYKKKKYFDLSKLHENREHELTPYE